MLSPVRSLMFRMVAVLVLVGASPARAELPDFRPLAAEASHAVVNISASTKSRARAAPQEVPEPFRRFFGDEFSFAPPPQDRQSSGTGFIISRDGYILTNNHVVQGADVVTVRLKDRRELDAEVVGTDERADVALLKIDAKDLPVLVIGDPEQLQVGEWVLAIGSPFGFDYSVTSGILSAKARGLPGNPYVPFLQTDVPINPGNSGGPLFNLQGQVVGINSQIFSLSRGYMGLSFAIPIDVAMESVEQIKASGHVTRGYLGVATQDVTRDLADAYNLPLPAGALVTRVMPGTPAEKAGVKDGDVITRFNGRDISLASDLTPLVGRAKVGSSYPLTVIREGKPLTISVEVMPLPDDQVATGSARPGKAGKPDVSRLGIAIRDLTADEKAGLKIESGVVVFQVNEVAAEAGLRPGDVITALQGKPVGDGRSFVESVKALPGGKVVAVAVNRRGHPLILALRLPAQEEDKANKRR
ncbi:MAG: DegQ family serine endoprotease [Pseudomonadota bacterium]